MYQDIREKILADQEIQSLLSSGNKTTNKDHIAQLNTLFLSVITDDSYPDSLKDTMIKKILIAGSDIQASIEYLIFLKHKFSGSTKKILESIEKNIHHIFPTPEHVQQWSDLYHAFPIPEYYIKFLDTFGGILSNEELLHYPKKFIDINATEEEEQKKHEALIKRQMKIHARLIKEINKIENEMRIQQGLLILLKQEEARGNRKSMTKIEELIKKRNQDYDIADELEHILSDAAFHDAHEVLDKIFKILAKNPILSQQALTQVFKVILETNKLIGMIRFLENKYRPDPTEMQDILKILFTQCSSRMQASFINYCATRQIKINYDVALPLNDQERRTFTIINESAVRMQELMPKVLSEERSSAKPPEMPTTITPLGRALLEGDRDALDALLNAGADPNQRIYDGLSLLAYTVTYGSYPPEKLFDIIASLLSAGVNIYQFSQGVPDFYKVLYWAMLHNHSEVSKLILNKLKSVPLLTEPGMKAFNPLENSELLYHPDILDRLLEIGGKKMLRQWGNAALLKLIESFDPKNYHHIYVIDTLLSALINHDVPLDQVDRKFNRNLIEKAADRGLWAIVSRLHSAGARSHTLVLSSKGRRIDPEAELFFSNTLTPQDLAKGTVFLSSKLRYHFDIPKLHKDALLAQALLQNRFMDAAILLANGADLKSIGVTRGVNVSSYESNAHFVGEWLERNLEKEQGSEVFTIFNAGAAQLFKGEFGIQALEYLLKIATDKKNTEAKRLLSQVLTYEKNIVSAVSSQKKVMEEHQSKGHNVTMLQEELRDQLARAINRQDTDAIIEAVKRGADLNYPGSFYPKESRESALLLSPKFEGMMPLQMAMMQKPSHKAEELFQLLIDLGADVQKTNAVMKTRFNMTLEELSSKISGAEKLTHLILKNKNVEVPSVRTPPKPA